MAVWQKVLIIIAVILVLLALFTPLFVFYFILGKPPRSTKIPKFYMNSPHYLVSKKGREYMETLNCEDVYLTSRDGLKLHGYLYNDKNTSAGESKKFILGVHGYKSYSRTEFAPFIQFYIERGYTVLLVDDRAHRPSEGKYIGFGVLDRLDCVDWSKYLVDRFGQDIKLFLQGVSMGSATVMAASGEADLPVQVKGVIADCGYTKAWDVLSFQMKHKSGMNLDWLLSLCEKIAVRKAGFNFHDYAPIDQIKKAKVPFLFVHGGKDTMVPPEMVHQLYEACPTEKKLLFVEEAGHGNSIINAPEEYHEALINFMGI